MMIDIIEVLRAWDYVLGSPTFTPAERRVIASELMASLPPIALCASAKGTHALTMERLRLATEKSNGTSNTAEPPEAEATPESESPETGQRVSGLREEVVVHPRNDRAENGRSSQVGRREKRR